MIPSIAKTLSSLLSFSWPPLSSSFPFVITILVANVFIFLPRLTEQRIRRRAGGARGTQQSHSRARAGGTGAGGRRAGGRRERGGCGQLLPHSPRQRRPAGHRRLGLAAGRRTPFALLMSLSAGCWRGVRAAESSPGGAPGLPMPRAGARREDQPPPRLRRWGAHPASRRAERTSREGGRGWLRLGPCKGGAPQRRRTARAKVKASWEGAACPPGAAGQEGGGSLRPTAPLLTPRARASPARVCGASPVT